MEVMSSSVTIGTLLSIIMFMSNTFVYGIPLIIATSHISVLFEST